MRVLAMAASAAALMGMSSPALAETTIESFSPSGTVKQVRQVTARFSGQVAPFGDLRLADPFTVDCAEKGAGRWIDGSNWSYDFERDVPAGVRCTFTLKADLKDANGKPVAGARQHTFSTGGPSVQRSLPYEGARIDENQVFVLGLDAPATDATILARAYCRAEGVNERIAVQLLGAKERAQLLGLHKGFVRGHLERFPGATDASLTALRCARTLPADKKVTLVWGSGIAAASGVATAADQPLNYRVRPDFTAKMSCERISARAQCIPFLPVRLTFSAPLAMASARAVTLTGADGVVYKPAFEQDERQRTHVSSLTFKGPFPEQSSLKLALPAGLKDDAGRPLVNQSQFPLTVQTAEQPPLVKFPARFGIVESKGERMLPVTVRNVEEALAGQMATPGTMLRVPDGAQHDSEVLEWLRALGTAYGGKYPDQYADRLKTSVFKKAKPGSLEKFTLPRANGARTFEVIGIPLPKPGFYVVEVESPMLGAALFDKKNAKAFVNSAALVTNMVAHFKHGAESSLVWVTSLDAGAPVPNAKVAVHGCAKEPLWTGTTIGTGIARIQLALPKSKCKQGEYFITARSGDDFTFTMSDWQGGIEPWRFNLPTDDANASNAILSTVFDRTLLRAGETVHMKHFNRRHTGRGIAVGGAPGKAELVHEGSGDRFPLPLTWQAGGSAESQWVIPAAAKQGTYEVIIGQYSTGSFRVEQFRVPTMRAVLAGPKAAVVGTAKIDLDLQINYLAGGGAAFAPVKLRTAVQRKGVSFDGYDGFSFAMGDVKEGVEKNGGMEDDDDCCEEGGEGVEAAGAASTRALKLDKAGGARIALDPLAAAAQPRDLVAEVSYPDANGETLTASTRVTVWPSRLVVGIKPDDWVMSKDVLKFQVAVLDVSGKPAADAKVAVDFLRRANYSHRRRLMGGFYAYEHSSEIKRAGLACEGKTDAKGLLLCEVKPPADGNLILRARVADEAQRVAVTQRDVWIAGSGDWWFNASDNDRIDLLPSKKQYAPGEQASFQVRSPFREATALVTVEREGILETYIRKLSGKTPTFTIPLKGHYAPNVYVSALVVRGRVAGVAPTALVDLGKPAYKLGMASIRVGWDAHTLKVQVSTDKPVYKVRDKASVKIKVTRADGSAPPAGSEVALAAVDEGLLELQPNTSWNLLESMMGVRSLQVETSTAQMQVIGKRHFGRKAFPHGGGGGKGGGRELFDTLLFWKARVALDAKGEASVQVPVNDSLTSFRIVAVANGAADLFGTGSTTIRSSQDLMILSGLPQLVREGDRLRAGFTVRNTTAQELKADVGATLRADGGPERSLGRQSVTLAPGQAQELGWDLQVPAGASALAWNVDASAGGAADRISVTQKVMPAVPVRTLQATLLQLDQARSMKVEAPAGALPGRGGISASFAARLGDDLPGVREYMARYRYSCYEQLASRAVALRDEAMWKANMDRLPVYMDNDGLLRYFPGAFDGSDTLTAYVLTIAEEAGYEIPQAAREKMEAGLQAFVEGRVLRSSGLQTADLALRKLAALESLSRRRPIPASSLESFTIQPDLWPTSAVIDWYLILKRSSALPQRDERMQHAARILRARLNLQGTTMTFSTERSDFLWWLMQSGDVNANRLLLAMLDQPDWEADMGRLARGTLGRMQHGHWATTNANAWGVLAMEKFSNAFEKAPVAGSTRVKLGGTTKEAVWSGAKAPAQSFGWASGSQELTLNHAGSGKPWATVSSTAAIPLAAPLSSGYRIAKTITPVEQKAAGRWSRGDIYRVRLDLEAQSDMTWVVVDDPIPASAVVLGTGLGGDSAIATGGQRAGGWVWPLFEERKQDAFRAYYSYVPKGKWTVEYTVRLNNQGRFNLPPTHVEAMYSPEMFGDLPNAVLEVGP